MKAVNLYMLTRCEDCAEMSALYYALSGRPYFKAISPHEAASLKSLADDLSSYFMRRGSGAAGWISVLDGFYFSYTIEHIGKEFDLLKLSEDTGCVLNIELKSEQVSEEKIRKQLAQNRYYLAHVAGTIYSCTYVLETKTLYFMNDKWHLRTGTIEELAAILEKDAFRRFIPENISRFFRASDYLLSPVAAPDKFLQGKYFLTNQQFDFRRRILEFLYASAHSSAALKKSSPSPVVSVSGIAGTGKTLLLFDLAVQLSKKDRVLFIHSGVLRSGHRTIDLQLKRVDIISGEAAAGVEIPGPYAALLIDEANCLEPEQLARLLEKAKNSRLPLIMTYDPHSMLESHPGTPRGDGSRSQEAADNMIRRASSLQLVFTGNIRINRPVTAFLRAMLNAKEYTGQMNFDCIDVLFAANRTEEEHLRKNRIENGYQFIALPGTDVSGAESDLTSVEFEKVVLVLDDTFYYNQDCILCTRDGSSDALRIIYEGLSRTRERLCLIITKNKELFSRLLEIRTGRRKNKDA